MAILERLGTKEELDDARDQTIRDINGKLRKLRFKETKLIKTPSGRAAVMVSPDIIDLSAPSKDDDSSTVGVSVIGGSGTVIRGPIGITGVPSDIRIAGMWKFNDVLLSAAPSTILTPIPVLRFVLPFGNIQEFAKVATQLGALGGVI